MNRSVKDAIILCVITLVAGLLLGGVYELTLDARTKQQEETLKKAYKEVFAQANSFEDFDYDEAMIENALDAEGITSKNVVVRSVVAAKDDKQEIVGYVVNVTSKEGFGGEIEFSVGINNDGKVQGVSITTISETAGLGMNAKNEDFLNQYKVDRTGLFVVKKDDGAKGTNVDALSGATITSKAVTKGVNTAVIVVDNILGLKEAQ